MHGGEEVGERDAANNADNARAGDARDIRDARKKRSRIAERKDSHRRLDWQEMGGFKNHKRHKAGMKPSQPKEKKSFIQHVGNFSSTFQTGDLYSIIC